MLKMEAPNSYPDTVLIKHINLCTHPTVDVGIRQWCDEYKAQHLPGTEFRIHWILLYEFSYTGTPTRVQNPLEGTGDEQVLSMKVTVHRKHQTNPRDAREWKSGCHSKLILGSSSTAPSDWFQNAIDVKLPHGVYQHDFIVIYLSREKHGRWGIETDRAPIVWFTPQMHSTFRLAGPSWCGLQGTLSKSPSWVAEICPLLPPRYASAEAGTGSRVMSQTQALWCDMQPTWLMLTLLGQTPDFWINSGFCLV